MKRFLRSLGLLSFLPALIFAAPPTPFPEIATEAARLDRTAQEAIAALKKDALPTREDIEARFPLSAFAHFGELVHRDAGAKLTPFAYPNLESQLAGFERVLSGNERLPDQLPVFVVRTALASRDKQYFFSHDLALLGSFTESGDSIEIATAQGRLTTTRTGALEALGEAIEPYQASINANDAFRVRNQLLKLAKDWDDFFEKGRPQTFWDIAATTLIEYKRIQTDRLVGPPDRQWFVLHPNVVIENIDAAPDGDQLGGAVMIEWLGVNWWRGIGRFKVPVGISASSLYSDRPGVSDVGHGVTLYLANKYCLGWANHGGDNGFYISLDALKLIDSKRSKLESYRAKLAQLRR